LPSLAIAVTVLDHLESKTMQKHLLIIEDDLEISELFQIIFELEAYCTTFCSIAPDPAFINDLNVHLIIMDIRLVGSKYNGAELCQMFKLQYPQNKTPVLLVSAEADGNILASKYGADGFMYKPFNIDDLLQRVAEMVA